MNSTEEYDNLNAQNVTIDIRGKYGNVYNLTLLNSLWRVDSYTNPGYAYKEKVNLTLEASKGTKENAYCSERGWCDFATGTCMCNKLDTGSLQYDYKSSNGYGEPGNRGDCGYPAIEARGCPAGRIGDKWVQCGGKGPGPLRQRDPHMPVQRGPLWRGLHVADVSVWTLLVGRS